MATLDDLRNVYESFCSFGSNRTGGGANLGSTDSLFVGPTMDGARFAKFARDSKIIDNKKISATDIDILFNKSKAKGARRLDWDSFVNAFQELAEKKYPQKNPTEALNALLNAVAFSPKGPKTSGTVASTDGVYDKLTNTNLYTGTHKHRFDEEGRGLGLDGRDQQSKTNTLESFIDRNVTTTITGAPISVSANASGISAVGGTSVGVAKKRGQTAVVTGSTEKLDLIANPRKGSKMGSNTSLNKLSPTKSASNSTTNLNELAPTKSASNSTTSLNRGTSRSLGSVNSLTGSIGNLNKPTTARKGSQDGVFDRLTNSNGYTGAHKHRFNADGTGRGIAGRDSPAKGGSNGTYRGGDVKDLSQILRN